MKHPKLELSRYVQLRKDLAMHGHYVPSYEEANNHYPATLHTHMGPMEVWCNKKTDQIAPWWPMTDIPKRSLLETIKQDFLALFGK